MHNHRFTSSTDQRNRLKHLLIKQAFSDYLALGSMGFCFAETCLLLLAILILRNPLIPDNLYHHRDCVICNLITTF